MSLFDIARKVTCFRTDNNRLDHIHKEDVKAFIKRIESMILLSAMEGHNNVGFHTLALCDVSDDGETFHSFNSMEQLQEVTKHFQEEGFKINHIIYKYETIGTFSDCMITIAWTKPNESYSVFCPERIKKEQEQMITEDENKQ